MTTPKAMASARKLQSDHALLADVVVARECTLAALEELGTHGPGASSAPADALVALQEAANRLGVAESILAELAHPRADVPAPILGPGDLTAGDPAAAWSGEAQAVMALAEFNVPYAADPTDEADRWLRALRRQGSVGRVLADLGFSDGELAQRAEPATGHRNLEPLDVVRAKAALLARHRSAETVTTSDILFAVLTTYGTLADRALYARGIERAGLLERLMGAAGAGAATLPA